MSIAEEILKYKELFEQNIITEEEFKKKKQELLESTTSQYTTKNPNKKVLSSSKLIDLFRKAIGAIINHKKIVLFVLAIGVACLVVTTIISGAEERAVKSQCKVVMDRYNVSNYSIKEAGKVFLSIKSKEIKNLDYNKMISLIKDLSKLNYQIDGEEITYGDYSIKLYVSNNDYYYYFSRNQAETNQILSSSLEIPLSSLKTDYGLFFVNNEDRDDEICVFNY